MLGSRPCARGVVLTPELRASGLGGLYMPAYSLAFMRTPTSVPLSVGEGVYFTNFDLYLSALIAGSKIAGLS